MKDKILGFIKKLKDNIYRKRFSKSIKVNYKWSKRKIKRFFKSDNFKKSIKSNFAKKLYFCVSLLVLLCTVFIVGDSLFEKLCIKDNSSILKMPSFNDDVPYLKSLDLMGSSNRLLVRVKTKEENNLKFVGTSLRHGSVNLVLNLFDGSTRQITLQNKYKQVFQSGYLDEFEIILPFGVSPFDIKDMSLSLLSDINNIYDRWDCNYINVYCLMENDAILLAKESWENSAVFGPENEMIKSSALQMIPISDQKTKLYETILKLQKKNKNAISDESLKLLSCESLRMGESTKLYIDIETTPSGRSEVKKEKVQNKANIKESDDLGYDYLMYLEITFIGLKQPQKFELDTLGKDDFELDTCSTFSAQMPEGMTIYDISSVRLVVDNPYDAYSFRFARLYTKLDLNQTLEISRITDTDLENKYSTSIFYKNLIDFPVEFDLTKINMLNKINAQKIKEEYDLELSGDAKEIYFGSISFFDRQIMYLNQIGKLA